MGARWIETFYISCYGRRLICTVGNFLFAGEDSKPHELLLALPKKLIEKALFIAF